MSIKNIKDIAKKLALVSPENLKLSLDEVHVKGLFSLIIAGTEPGKLTRVFIATKKINPFDAQLHSHTYGLKITAIKGHIKHHIATDGDQFAISKYDYKSPLNGGNGLSYVGNVKIDVHDCIIPPGASTILEAHEIHTISCSKGSIWVVEESGFCRKFSTVLGNCFSTENLYKTPKHYQINDMFQLVNKEVKKIVLDHRVVTND